MELKPSEKFAVRSTIFSKRGEAGAGVDGEEGEVFSQDLTAALLIWFLRGLFFLVLIDVVLHLPFLSPNKVANGALVGWVATTALLIPYLLLRRGRPVLAARLCVTSVAIASTILALFARGGVNNIGTTFQLAVAAIAGVMLGPRWGSWIAALCLTADLANALGEFLGHPMPVFFYGGPMAAWVGLVMMFPIILVPLSRAFRVQQRQLVQIRQTERALRDERDRSQGYLDTVECIILGLDAGGRITNINKMGCRLLGYPADELLGREWFSTCLPSPQGMEKIYPYFLKLIAGELEVAEYYENNVLTRSGEVRRIAWHNSLLRDDQGRIVGTLSAGEDITERRRAEEERNSLQAQLTQSQKREVAELRETQRLARLGSWSWDVGANTVSWSEQLYRNCGMDPSEPVPDFEGQARFYTAESWDSLTAAVQAAVRDGTPYSLELRLNQSDPLPEWIIARGEAVTDADGKITGLRGTAQDITERRRLEMQLAQAQRMESIGRLAGGVAHDFNNMLTVILGYSAMVRSKLPPDLPVQKFLTEIQNAGERSKQIAHQLLGFSRQQIIAPEPSNLNALVQGLMEPLGRLIGEDIELSFFPGKDLWTVLVDASQVNQVLLNLVVNARDAMPSGGKLTIETENARISPEYCQTHPEAIPGSFAVLTVTDTGVGISPELLPKIFEPFFTTKGQDQGTGLGLAMVYGIAKQNGGFVNVYSEPGQGTAFRIYIPRLAGDAPAVEETGPSEGAEMGSGNVLVVEDDGLVRKLVTSSLEQLGYSALVAESPAQAIALCAGEAGSSIRLVLTDVVMPGMHGMEMRDRICEVRPAMRVLFMSGYTSNVIVKHGVLKPGVHFIQKPFTIDELGKRITEALG